MAGDKTYRQELNEIARALGGKLITVNCYALKRGDEIILLDSELSKVHTQLMTIKMERENESN